MSYTITDLLQYGKEQLQKANIIDWDYDSRILLEWVCHMSRIDILMEPNQNVSDEKATQYQKLISKRASHEPLQYLMGECEFMGLPFLVNPNVLIPRQDTEILVEWILEREKREGLKLLDVCTGSGCIAVSLSALGEKMTVDAVDISSKALLTARKNAKKNQVNINFIHSNMFEKVNQIYDVIVSNPPYIPSVVIEGLMEEVRDHEPRLALDGEADGLHFYRILALESPKYLIPGGRLYLEIGHDQGISVPNLLREAGFTEIQVKKDFAGNDRAVAAIFP